MSDNSHRDTVTALRTLANIGKIGDLVEDLISQRDRLRRQVEGLESLRPVWAWGDSQSVTAALAQVWDCLGSTNQTDCMQAIRRMHESEGRIDSALAALAPYLDTGDSRSAPDWAVTLALILTGGQRGS